MMVFVYVNYIAHPGGYEDRKGNKWKRDLLI